MTTTTNSTAVPVATEPGDRAFTGVGPLLDAAQRLLAFTPSLYVRHDLLAPTVAVGRNGQGPFIRVQVFDAESIEELANVLGVEVLLEDNRDEDYPLAATVTGRFDGVAVYVVRVLSRQEVQPRG